MKSLIRKIIINALALFVSSQILSGLKIHGGWSTILISAIALTIMSYLLKPILHIITLPLNLMTFGLFSFLINAIILYFLTVFVPQVSINGFVFPGIHFMGFVVPAVAFSTLLAYIVSSFMISFIVSFMMWLME